MAEVLREHGITKELSIKLDRNFKVEALCFLNRGRSGQSAQAQPQTKQTRRASVAGTNVFVIGGLIRETGFDYLDRIPRSNNVQIGQSDSTYSTAATNNFSLKIGNRPTCPTDELPLTGLTDPTDPTDPCDACDASGNTMKSAESAIMGASVIHSMESFHSLARRNDGETGETQHAQSIHLSYRLNFESDAFVPSDESVKAHSLFGDAYDADSSLDGAREVDIYDDVDDLGLNRLFIEPSDLNSNEETNNGADMESSRLFDEMGSSGSSDSNDNDYFGIASLYIDNLGEENCKY